VRRAVLARDRQRCRVPGRTHGALLDIHHVRPLSEGGRHDPENLVTLCGAHHRAIHRGGLFLSPNRDGIPTFRHADGSAYGHAVAPQVVDAQAKVFAALRNLAFANAKSGWCSPSCLQTTNSVRQRRNACCVKHCAGFAPSDSGGRTVGCRSTRGSGLFVALCRRHGIALP
jgi:hypothetical protein